MKIGALTTNATSGVLSTSQQRGSQILERSFAQIRTELAQSSQGAGIFGPDITKDLEALTRGVLQGKQFSPQELLVYQIKAGQFALRVELVTKTAEAAVSTLKKLQNPQ